MISSKKAMTTPTLNILVVDELHIPYVIQRKRKQGISFRFLNTTLVVSAPLEKSIVEIEAGLRTKTNWIKKHYVQKLEQVLPANQRRILGKVVTVEQRIGADFQVDLYEQRLIITHRASQSEKSALSAALRSLAEREISGIFNEVCKRIGQRPQSVTFKNLRSSLGRCSSKKEIVFALRLIHYPPEVIVAVCYHELAHLKHMNHSKRFYALLESWMPTYRQVMKNAKRYPSVSAID